MKSLLLILTLFNIMYISKQDAVCTESILLTELLQDIADNNKLDCLREPLPAPTDHTETDVERKKEKKQFGILIVHLKLTMTGFQY